MKTILLKFAGPLQSWGTRSNFETRHTDCYPSKSGVIGLIAASMGLKRDSSDIKALNDIDFAVRIDQPGNLIRDYHTAKKYKKTGDLDRTYVTNRYYLEDAVFVVAISQTEDLVDKILTALKQPYYQAYMGRRALPLPADFIMGVYDGDAISCLKDCPWQAASWYHKTPVKKLTAYADSHLVDQGQKNLRKDGVESFSQKNRSFSFRYETRFEIILPAADERPDHDAFSALGG
ncbi:type I-E CRISPR-associated protein Cas5/CasD [Aerococcus urinaehominis]|uniref:Type I-E CRISPR-associated protein Cas5/CasD n=1 Tax=Aerococcus urinaehominis TaxID=128944 RepID=A0A120IB42_9LACT|nr:type I-E CRISPR-associated protein Cas5/CasD [Aerococcus urinaehominis]AMC00074.1 type I-E CRISPR-associated protein Cas5/CasD [Aerococcus urinaehominis]